MVDKALPSTVERLHILLFHGLKRDETHAGSPDGFTQGFSVVPVVLVALDERLYILWANDTHTVSRLLERACPVKSARIGLDGDQAGFDVRNDLQQFFPMDATLERWLALRVDTVKLKDILSEVDPQNGNFHRFVLPAREYRLPDYGASRTLRRRAVHPIRWQRRYREQGQVGLVGHRPQPGAAWIRMRPEKERAILRAAPAEPNRSPREISYWLSDHSGSSVSESSLYRVLKRHGLIREVNVLGFPAGKEYRVKTTRPNEQWQSDASYFFVVG